MRTLLILSMVVLVVPYIIFGQADTQEEKPDASVEQATTIEELETQAEEAEVKTIEKLAPQNEEAESENETGTSESGITVARTTLCTEIVDREPQGSADKFSKDVQKLYCFSEISGVQDPITLVHKWYYNYQLVGSIALRVKAKRWRTFSSKKIMPEQVGDWKVEIVNGANEEVLKMVTFLVE